MKKVTEANSYVVKTILLVGFVLMHLMGSSQDYRIKILKEDSTFLNSNGDSSYIYNSVIYSGQLSSISSVTLVASDYSNSQWVITQDTSYTCSQVSATSHNNATYAICKPNQNVFKLCLGRLHFNSRKRFNFYIMNTNTTLITKQMEF